MAVEKVPCRECDDAVAEIRGGVLFIVSKHHGRKHHNKISLAWLIKKLEESKRGNDTIAAK